MGKEKFREEEYIRQEKLIQIIELDICELVAYTNASSLHLLLEFDLETLQFTQGYRLLQKPGSLNNMKNNLLKDTGLKNTEARMAVLACLESELSPMDAGSLFNFLKKQGISADQATVYRILNTFYEKGIVKRIEIGEGKYRYEVTADDHHHLICTNCGRIEDIEDKFMDEIEKEIYKKKGFRVKSHSLEFFGLCRKCQQ